MDSKLSHIDKSGHARMVDISEKEETERIAVAKGAVIMLPNTLDLIASGSFKKGDVLATAQVAGVMAAKRTAELIPLCHPLGLDQVLIQFNFNRDLPGIDITATVKTFGKTGVEMESLTAVSVAALTIYDMAKSAEKTMRIENIRLVEKRGGQSGVVINK